MFSLILLVFAFVLSVIAGALNSPPPAEPWRWRLMCFSLACYFLAEIVKLIPTIHLG